jgi:hypothetical protein
MPCHELGGGWLLCVESTLRQAQGAFYFMRSEVILSLSKDDWL